jgi:hypothetical protein
MEAGELHKGKIHSTATDPCLFMLKLVTKLMSTVTRMLLAKQTVTDELNNLKQAYFLLVCFYLSGQFINCLHSYIVSNERMIVSEESGRIREAGIF